MDRRRRAAAEAMARRRHAHNYCVLARRQADEGRFDEALVCLARARRLDPSNSDVRRASAAVYYAMGDLAAAEQELDHLHSSLEPDATTCHLLGNICLARNDGPRALHLYAEAASLGGDGPELCYNRALARYYMADLEGGEAEFRAALRFDPGYGRAMDGLGCLERARGRTESAMTWFRMAAEADESLCEAHEHLGEMLLEQGRLEEAERYLEHARALDLERPRPHQLLGEIHAARQEWRQALFHWQRAADSAPGCDEALHGVARACLALGRANDAREYLEQSLHANPGNIRARVDLGALYLRAGERHRALEHLRQAQRLAGDNRQIATLIARALWAGK